MLIKTVLGQLRLWLLADYKNNIKSRCWRTREPYWEDDGDAELGWACE